jgi:membrane protein YdbS with pleckstrin-like domain
MNPEDMINQISGRLSLRRRVATVVALLGGLAVAAVVGLLWVTEPGLPPRTQVAFGAIVVAGLAWVTYGVWC